jgi:hypothetical protein
MYDKSKYLVLVGAVALFAGCSSSSNSIDDDNPAFTALLDDATTMAAGLVDLDTGASLAAERTNLPESGGVTFTGFVGGDVDGATLIGELTLNATFAAADTGSITGSATGFEHETDGAYTGTLDVDPMTSFIIPGTMSSDADVLTVDLSGNLQNGGMTYATDITLEGSFFGGADNGSDDPTAVGGAAFGDVGADSFDGAFVATSP